MANFNTNQARHLYVALDVKTLSSQTTDPATVLTTAGDIALVADEDKHIAFVYRNADGIITRSDMIDTAKIQYITKAEAADLATPLNKKTITLASGVTLASLVGKQIQLTIVLREFVGLDYSENYPLVVNVSCNSTNTASAAAFYAALKSEVDDAIKQFKSAPFATSSSGSGLVLTEAAQQWVADKFEADPIHFDVFCSELEATGEPWGNVVMASAGTSITGDFKIADLERFSYRERSEVYGMTVWPYNYERKYLVNPVAGTNTFGMLTIQYYYSGNAEDIQKSPRTIQIAAADEDVAALKTAIDAVIAGGEESEGEETP